MRHLHHHTHFCLLTLLRTFSPPYTLDLYSAGVTDDIYEQTIDEDEPRKFTVARTLSSVEQLCLLPKLPRRTREKPANMTTPTWDNAPRLGDLRAEQWAHEAKRALKASMFPTYAGHSGIKKSRKERKTLTKREFPGFLKLKRPDLEEKYIVKREKEKKEQECNRRSTVRRRLEDASSKLITSKNH